MNGERQIGAQPDLGLQSIDAVAAFEAQAVGRQAQAAAVDQLVAAMIAVVSGLQHRGAVGLFALPIDAIGIADRRGAHQRFELAMGDKARGGFLRQRQRVVAGGGACDRRPVAGSRRRHAAVDEQQLLAGAHFE